MFENVPKSELGFFGFLGLGHFLHQHLVLCNYRRNHSALKRFAAQIYIFKVAFFVPVRLVFICNWRVQKRAVGYWLTLNARVSCLIKRLLQVAVHDIVGIVHQKLAVVPVSLNIISRLKLVIQRSPWHPGRKGSPVLHNGWKIEMDIVWTGICSSPAHWSVLDMNLNLNFNVLIYFIILLFCYFVIFEAFRQYVRASFWQCHSSALTGSSFSTVDAVAW